MGGCAPYSIQPPTDVGKEEIDSSMFGTWCWWDEDQSGYMHIGLCKNDRRSLHVLTASVVEAANRNDFLKGNIREDGWISSMEVTENQWKLRRFVRKYDDDLFEEKLSLERLRPSSPTWRAEIPCGPDAMNACLKSHG